MARGIPQFPKQTISQWPRYTGCSPSIVIVDDSKYKLLQFMIRMTVVFSENLTAPENWILFTTFPWEGMELGWPMLDMEDLVVGN